MTIFFWVDANKFNWFTYYLQDPEKGLGGGISTEEAINILVKSYDSSEISHQVQKELAQIKIRVSLVTPLEGRNGGTILINL